MNAMHSFVRGTNRLARQKMAVALVMVVFIWPATLFADAPVLVPAQPEPASPFECFPPEDKSPCPDNEDEFDPIGKAFFGALAECGKTAQNSDTQMKYGAIAALMAGGPAGLVAAEGLAASALTKDFIKCALKGFVESTDAPPEDKKFYKDSISVAFEVYNVKGFADSLFKWKYMDPKVFQKTADLYAKSIQRAQGLKAYASAYRSMKEFLPK